MCALQVDQITERVAVNAEAWTKVSYAEKLSILRELLAIATDLQEEVGQASVKVRNLGGTYRSATGYVLSIIPAVGYLHGLIEVYESLATTGQVAPVVGRRKVGNTEVVQTMPRPTLWAKLTNPMVTELWGEPGKPMPQHKGPIGGPGVCAVLEPGNFEAPVDALFKLFVEQEVCIIKTHPINAASSDIFLRRLFEPLVSRGFAGLATGGPDVGKHLLHNKRITSWMITGGCATFDAIVWGGKRRDGVVDENAMVFLTISSFFVCRSAGQGQQDQSAHEGVPRRAGRRVAVHYRAGPVDRRRDDVPNAHAGNNAVSTI